jgi:hypothetical protein
VQISLPKMELLWQAYNIMQQPTAGLKHFLFGEFQHARTTKDTIMAPKNTKTSRSWIPKSTGIYTQFKFNLRNSRGDPPDQSWRGHQPNYQLYAQKPNLNTPEEG